MTDPQTTALVGIASIIEQSFCDVCDELGCERDNEAALMAAARMRTALRIIAGEIPCADNLLGNAGIARIALHGE